MPPLGPRLTAAIQALAVRQANGTASGVFAAVFAELRWPIPIVYTLPDVDM